MDRNDAEVPVPGRHLPTSLDLVQCTIQTLIKLVTINLLTSKQDHSASAPS